MKVKQVHGENIDGMGTLKIEINGKGRIYAGPGEPEDMSLGRNMNFVYDIVPLMKEAWQAGKNGETWDASEENE